MNPSRCDNTLDPLVDLALHLGATAAAVIPAADISAEDELALLCRQPRCPNFGLSLSCPPHVAGPDYFRNLQKTFTEALVVKIDVPTDILLSNERLEVMGLLHGIVAQVEQSARAAGFVNAAAFAGSSCKQLFCQDHALCRALAGECGCRNPQLARPSMSGFGINVSRLMQAAGWSAETLARRGAAGQSSMSWVTGLVLIR